MNKIRAKTGMSWRTSLLALCLVALAGCSPQSPSHAGDPSPSHSAQAAAMHGSASMQAHREWTFAADGVTFSNRMPSARLNGVERLGPDHYVVTIAPENQPINDSPWFGFSLASTAPRDVRVEFDYVHGKHRYQPKLSRDGEHWRAATDAEFGKGDNGRQVLSVSVDATPLRIFAQPPITPVDFREWEAQLPEQPNLRTDTIGQSVQGRALRMLSFGNPDADRVLLVLGRQHPPETTGTRALMPFVERLLADTPQARRFRADTQVLVVPLMNPDGVVEGHWRSNANGKDLNRDWGVFSQPETRAVRAMMKQQIDATGRDLVFAIDFHSTWNDVFYTVNEAPSRQPGGVLRRWIDAMQAHFPGRIREVANDAKGTVFKNWAFKQYHAPTVTYEVGDRTGAEQIREIGTFAADQLMQILLEDASADSRPPA